VVTVERTGYCGDGIINGNELCDTSLTDTYYPGGPSVIYAKNLKRDSAPTTLPTPNVAAKGYVVNFCFAEKNNKINSSVIASNITDPFSTELSVRKKGARSCVNNCAEIQDGCTSCGIDTTDGSKVGGYLVNLINDTISDPLYIHNLAVQDNLQVMQRTSLELVYSSVVGGEVAKFVPNFNYRNNRFDFKNVDNLNVDALINTNPACSVTTTDSNDYYRLMLNQDSDHLFDLDVVSDPAPWQYDMAITPVLRKYSGSYKNLNLKAYPKYVRIVLSYVGDQPLHAGFSAISGKAFMFEGANIEPSVRTGTWKSLESQYASYVWPNVPGIDQQSHIWYHGFHAAPSTFQVEAYSVLAGNLPNYAYAFYVRSPYQPISFYRSSRVRVDVYFPETTDNGDDWRKFALPAKTFWLSDAEGSDNQSAQYWHVFNVKNVTADFATENNAIDIKNANRLVTGLNQIEF